MSYVWQFSLVSMKRRVRPRDRDTLPLRVQVEKHSDGYVAYPLGIGRGAILQAARPATKPERSRGLAAQTQAALTRAEFDHGTVAFQ